METATIQALEFERTQTTDPRETRLRDIIEKGKASLRKALEEIQHEFSIREDMAVRPIAIDLLVQDHKIKPVIRDEAFDLTDHSHQYAEGQGSPKRDNGANGAYWPAAQRNTTLRN